MAPPKSVHPGVDYHGVECLPRLIEALYAGIADESPWVGFLDALAGGTEATSAILILAAPGYRGPGLFESPGTDQAARREYIAGLFARDPFVGLPQGWVTSFAEFVDPGSVSDAFRSYLRKGKIAGVLGVDIREEAGWEARFRLTRDIGHPEFDTGAREILTGLVPHLRIAVRLFARLQATAAEQHIYSGTIEQLAFSLIILDRRGSVLRSNRVADRLLSKKDGLQVAHGKLRIADRTASTRLFEVLAARPPLDRAVEIRIPRPSGATELGAIARAVPTPDYLAASGAVLALFIADPEERTNINPDVLCNLFQLTPAESHLAVCLSGGLSLSEAAIHLGTSYNTARNHLRSIFSKTGIHRQAQLVRLLRASVAGLA